VFCNNAQPPATPLRSLWQPAMKEIGSLRHERLRKLIKLERTRAELSQEEVAERIGRGQTFVSAVERGQHKLGVLEFLELAEAIGFDPFVALRQLAKIKRD
jgi:ribosome-binding protein aMBF1 (putative translation factor)